LVLVNLRDCKPQGVLPGVDVSELVQLHPRAFLDPPQTEMITRLGEVNDLLRAELEGADIDRMLTEDPLLLRADPVSLSKGEPTLHSIT